MQEEVEVFNILAFLLKQYLDYSLNEPHELLFSHSQL